MDNKDAIIETYRSKSEQIDNILSDILSIVRQGGNDKLEGNAFYCHMTTIRFPEYFPKQVNLFWAGLQAKKKICEIGFNAGHSALLLLLGSKPDVHIDFTIFDIGHHFYTRPCMEYISKKFPHVNMTYSEGDSTIVIPSVIQENPEMCETYDVVHVDGGHTEHCIQNDLFNAAKLVKKDGYIVVDDTNINYINALVDKYIASGFFKEIDCLPTSAYAHRILQRIL
jgi:hypothetical protein